MDKQAVAAGRVEPLHEPTPALVAAAGSERDRPPLADPAARSLDLHAHELAVEVRDQIVIGTVSDRDRDHRALARQPAHRRHLPKVPLPPRRPPLVHPPNISRPTPETPPFAAYEAQLLESLYRTVTPLLDQLLFPQRLVIRALDDLHRIAEAGAALGALAKEARPLTDHMTGWMDDTASTLRSLRNQAAGVRTTIEPMGEDVRILKDEFARANDEIARLREAFGPQLESLRESAAALHQELRQVRELFAALEGDVNQMGDRVTTEMAALRDAIRALVRDANEISDVVEPLQSATDRVGKIADRLPGRNR